MDQGQPQLNSGNGTSPDEGNAVVRTSTGEPMPENVVPGRPSAKQVERNHLGDRRRWGIRKIITVACLAGLFAWVTWYYETSGWGEVGGANASRSIKIPTWMRRRKPSPIVGHAVVQIEYPIRQHLGTYLSICETLSRQSAFITRSSRQEERLLSAEKGLFNATNKAALADDDDLSSSDSLTRPLYNGTLFSSAETVLSALYYDMNKQVNHYVRAARHTWPEAPSPDDDDDDKESQIDGAIRNSEPMLNKADDLVVVGFAHVESAYYAAYQAIDNARKQEVGLALGIRALMFSERQVAEHQGRMLWKVWKNVLGPYIIRRDSTSQGGGKDDGWNEYEEWEATLEDGQKNGTGGPSDHVDNSTAGKQDSPLPSASKQLWDHWMAESMLRGVLHEQGAIHNHVDLLEPQILGLADGLASMHKALQDFEVVAGVWHGGACAAATAAAARQANSWHFMLFKMLRLTLPLRDTTGCPSHSNTVQVRPLWDELHLLRRHAEMAPSATHDLAQNLQAALNYRERLRADIEELVKSATAGNGREMLRFEDSNNEDGGIVRTKTIYSFPDVNVLALYFFRLADHNERYMKALEEHLQELDQEY